MNNQTFQIHPLFLIILAVCLLSTQGLSQYTFTGNGNWSDPSNWSGNSVPPDPVFDDITIDGDCIMDLLIATVGNITINSSLQIDGELNVDGVLDNFGDVNIQSGGRLEINQVSYNYNLINVFGEFHVDDFFMNEGTINCEAFSTTSSNTAFPYPSIENNQFLYIKQQANFNANLTSNNYTENFGTCNIPVLFGSGGIVNWGMIDISNLWGLGWIENYWSILVWSDADVFDITNDGFIDFFGELSFDHIQNNSSIYFGDNITCNSNPFFSLNSNNGSLGGNALLYNTDVILSNSNFYIQGEGTFTKSFTSTNSSLELQLKNATTHDRIVFEAIPSFTNTTILVDLFFNYTPAIGDTFPIIKGVLDTDGLSFDLPELVNAHFGVFYDKSDSTLILEVLEGERRERIGINTDNPLSELDINTGNLFFSDLTGGLILEDSNGDCFKTTVSTGGTLTTVSITCPMSTVDKLLIDAADNLILNNGDVLLSENGTGLILRDQTGKCHRLTIDNSGNTNVSFTSCPNESPNSSVALIAKENEDTELKNGDLYVKDSDHGIILKDGNGNCYKSSINGNGQLQFTLINCKVY